MDEGSIGEFNSTFSFSLLSEFSKISFFSPSGIEDEETLELLNWFTSAIILSRFSKFGVSSVLDPSVAKWLGIEKFENLNFLSGYKKLYFGV